MKRRVLLVDDHAVVRHGLQEILSASIPELEFGSADDWAGAIQLLTKEKWHVAILDLNLSGGKSGLELLKSLKALQPEIAILIYSMHSEEQFGVRAIKAGAAGYLSKSNDVGQVVAAVRDVLAGARHITPAVAQAMADMLQERAGDPHEGLSDREYQIFRLLASGSATGKIAEELGLSPKTVSTYRARVLEKLGLKTTADLIRYAIERGLI
jgi:two-component system, NarL family, invasion response regulator UvrY